MHEEIVALARTVLRDQEADETLLDALCTAAEEQWTARLREGLRPEDCGSAFCCAAAFTAAADLSGSEESGPASFTAGSVTIRGESAGERGERSRLLRLRAEQLMAPCTADSGFAFRGVRA